MLTLAKIDAVGVASQKVATAHKKFEEAKLEINAGLAELTAAINALQDHGPTDPGTPPPASPAAAGS